MSMIAHVTVEADPLVMHDPPPDTFGASMRIISSSGGFR